MEQRPATINLSLRGIALTLVIMMAFVLVFPRLQAYLTQRQQIAQAAAEIAAAEDRVVALQAQLERWQNPDWIAQQARVRLNYVFPGETAYRVVDPEYITDALAGAEVDPAQAPTVLTGITKVPWYHALWDSVTVADQIPLPVEPLPAIISDGTEGADPGTAAGEEPATADEAATDGAAGADLGVESPPADG